MRCDFNLCIYNYEMHCMLEEVTVNPSGGCNECTPVVIPEEELNQYKFSQINESGGSDGLKRIQ